jgi:hypothetical protein
VKVVTEVHAVKSVVKLEQVLLKSNGWINNLSLTLLYIIMSILDYGYGCW